MTLNCSKTLPIFLFIFFVWKWTVLFQDFLCNLHMVCVNQVSIAIWPSHKQVPKLWVRSHSLLGHSKLYPGFWSTACINFGKIHFLDIILYCACTNSCPASFVLKATSWVKTVSFLCDLTYWCWILVLRLFLHNIYDSFQQLSPSKPDYVQF